MALSELFLIGLNHASAPVEVRECLAFSEDEKPAFLEGLKSKGVLGAVLLSTCNRVELYLDVPEGLNLEKIIAYMLENRKIPNVPGGHFYIKSGRELVSHIFRVASGLDSMILGEPQILGQVKDAYFSARSGGHITTPLNLVFQRTQYVAKKVRTESGIGRHPVTVSYAAFNLAKSIFSDLDSKKVLLLGAGEMIRIIATHFYNEGSKNVTVANRTYERALEFSIQFDARVSRWEDFPRALLHSDLVITSTAASTPIILKSMMETVMKLRKWEPLLIIDIAVPRDVEEGVADVDGVYLYDIDDLQKVADQGLEERKKRSMLADQMIEEEVALYGHFLEHRELPRIIENVVDRVNEIGENEIRGILPKLGGAGGENEELLRKVVYRVVHKLMHSPITQLKKLVLEEERDDAIEIFERFFLEKEGKETPEENRERSGLN
jgi:glutamyl-tRNA reductase